MRKTTLEALKASIKKWERIVAGTGIDNGSDNCPLCKKFSHNNCDGCPVKMATGCADCKFSPYEEWADCFSHRFPRRVANSGDIEQAKIAAKKELNFLRSLLPEDRNDLPNKTQGHRNNII